MSTSEAGAATAATWDALPDSLALRILSLVPVDTRLRCSEVRRDWRRLLGSAAAWTRLNLSPAGCATCRAASEEVLLRGFAAKAAGALAFLDVSGRAELPVAALLDVVAANAATLKTLRATVRRVNSKVSSGFSVRSRAALTRRAGAQTLVLREDHNDYTPHSSGSLTLSDAAALLDAAPQMMLRAPVRCTAADAPRLLNEEAPFDRLRLWRLSLIDTLQSTADEAVSSLRSFAGVRAGQSIPPPPVDECITPLAAALRANNSLTWLDVDAIVTRKSVAALAVLTEALTAHPSLRVLRLTLSDSTLHNFDRILERDDVALRALCALVEADSAALRELRLWGEAMGDDVLAPLLDALARNTRLRVLDFGARSTISQALTTERLLPAVRAATALRVLGLNEHRDGAPALQEAQAMLQARVAADAAA
jgi:hypothetical protein